VGLWRVFNIGTRSARTEQSNSNIHFWQDQVRPVVSQRLTSLSGSAPAASRLQKPTRRCDEHRARDHVLRPRPCVGCGRGTLNRTFAAAAQAAGIGSATPHSLRHGYATRLLENPSSFPNIVLPAKFAAGVKAGNLCTVVNLVNFRSTGAIFADTNPNSPATSRLEGSTSSY
jgi:hypothetical protein